MVEIAAREEIDSLVDELEQEERQSGAHGREPESEKSQSEDMLGQDEIDQLMEALEPERDERLTQVTPERIAEEWGQLSETARSVVQNASDEKFNEITKKYIRISQTERKAKIMIIMRRLINRNHPLAGLISEQADEKRKAA